MRQTRLFALAMIGLSLGGCEDHLTSAHTGEVPRDLSIVVPSIPPLTTIAAEDPAAFFPSSPARETIFTSEERRAEILEIRHTLSFGGGSADLAFGMIYYGNVAEMNGNLRLMYDNRDIATRSTSLSPRHSLFLREDGWVEQMSVMVDADCGFSADSDSNHLVQNRVLGVVTSSDPGFGQGFARQPSCPPPPSCTATGAVVNSAVSMIDGAENTTLGCGGPGGSGGDGEQYFLCLDIDWYLGGVYIGRSTHCYPIQIT